MLGSGSCALGLEQPGLSKKASHHQGPGRRWKQSAKGAQQTGELNQQRPAGGQTMQNYTDRRSIAVGLHLAHLSF